MMLTLLTLLSFVSTSIPAPDFTAYAGNYRIAPTEVIAIAEWELDPGSPHVLAFTNLKTGRIGVLSELGTDEFGLHEGLLTGPQIDARKKTTRLNNSEDAARVANIREWIGVEQDEIGDLAHRKRAELVIESRELRGSHSGAPERIAGRQPCVFHQSA